MSHLQIIKRLRMRILIYGAGSTGCFIAAECLDSGLDTSLVCRARVAEAITKSEALRFSDYTGTKGAATLPLMFTELPDLQETNFDLCFVTLKCHHLESAIEDLVRLANSGCELHFLQNGLNAYTMHSALNALKHCFSGITPFNVVMLEEEDSLTFHKGTEGTLQLQNTRLTEKLQHAFRQRNKELELYEDIQPIVFGKLLLNLNNALNALSGVPLKQQLEDRQLRLVLARAMREYLAVCKVRNQELKISAPIPPRLLPALLSLPNFLFKRIAKQMLEIDPLARSSMWEDIKAGRKTEIEFLNGMVVSLGKESGIACPTNGKISHLIARLEGGEIVEREDVVG